MKREGDGREMKCEEKVRKRKIFIITLFEFEYANKLILISLVIVPIEQFIYTQFCSK